MNKCPLCQSLDIFQGSFCAPCYEDVYGILDGETADLIEDEIFVGVKGFPSYEISNYGCVRNRRTKLELKEIVSKGGYIHVSLKDEQHKSKTASVHRLVAAKFLPDYSDNYGIEHINANFADNSHTNLRMSKTFKVTSERKWK